MFPRRQSAAAIPRLLILAALCIGLFSANAQAEESSCAAAGDIAVLPSPITPWTGAPLRVLFVVDKPIQGELALVAPDGSVAATSRDRKGGPPYFWYAEVKSPAAGTWHARLEHAPAECSKIAREISVRKSRPAPPHATGEQRLALAPFLEPRDGEPLFGVAGIAVRCAGRPGADLARDGQGGARPLAQFPVRLFGSARRQHRHAPRLRGLPVLPAHLFLLQAGAAVRLFGLLARLRRPPAEMPGVDEHSGSGAFARAGLLVPPISAGRRRRRADRQRPHAGERQQKRLLSGAADAGDACAPAPSTPIPMGTS